MSAALAALRGALPLFALIPLALVEMGCGVGVKRCA